MPGLPHGVYAIVDGPAARPPLDLVGAFVRGGASVVQLRLKGIGTGDFVRIAREARRICANRALLLGTDALPVPAARNLLGPGALIGLSTHSEKEIDEAAGADYIGFGPVFATQSKPGAPLPPPHGIEGLRRAVRRAKVPVVAIGGITVDNVAQVARTGARCAAAISALCNAANPEQDVRAFAEAWGPSPEALQ